jgi:predicted secreted Zn-dependent protease
MVFFKGLMRGKGFIGLAGGLVAGLATVTWAADPDLIVATPTLSPYKIQGKTAAELRTQMNQLGPLKPEEGKRFDASTLWDIDAQFTYGGKKGKSCQFKSIKVTVNTTFILPEWTPPAGTPQSLIDRWKKHLSALQTHEDGHKQLGIDAGNDFLSQLKAMPAATSCDALKESAAKKRDAVKANFKQKHQAYDKSTNHGATQGAVFP